MKRELLGGRILTFLAAPDGEQQVNRNQFQFPGQEEQEHVLNGEHRDLATVHGQQQKVEELGFEAHRPGGETGQGRDEAGEQDQGHRQAVGSNRPGQTELRQPGDVLPELEARVGGVVLVEIRADGEQEGGERHAKGEPPHLFTLALIGDKGNEKGCGDRKQDRSAQPGEGHGLGTPIPGV
jgi:hypothetical protein